jgi:hypothetical protein
MGPLRPPTRSSNWLARTRRRRGPEPF